MSPKWIVFIVFIFILQMLMGMVIEGSNLSTEVQRDLNIVSHWGVVSEEQTFGTLDYVKAPVEYFLALFRLLTYKSPAFFGEGGEANQYEIVRWVFVAPILAGVSFGLVVLFFSAFRRVI